MSQKQPNPPPGEKRPPPHPAPLKSVSTELVIAELEHQLAAERERADYAWRNTRTVEASRQEEMRKRDSAEAENAKLRALAKAVLDTRNAEAKAAMTWENAQANYQSCNTEAHEHELAMVAASEAERALHAALATPNVKVTGSAPTGLQGGTEA